MFYMRTFVMPLIRQIIPAEGSQTGIDTKGTFREDLFLAITATSPSLSPQTSQVHPCCALSDASVNDSISIFYESCNDTDAENASFDFWERNAFTEHLMSKVLWVYGTREQLENPSLNFLNTQ